MKVYLFQYDPVHDVWWRLATRRFRFRMIARVYGAVAALWWDRVEVREDD